MSEAQPGREEAGIDSPGNGGTPDSTSESRLCSQRTPVQPHARFISQECGTLGIQRQPCKAEISGLMCRRHRARPVYRRVGIWQSAAGAVHDGGAGLAAQTHQLYSCLQKDGCNCTTL